MKKLSLLVVLVAFTMATALAQIGLGIKGGVNFANVDIQDVSTDSKTGFHFGAFVEVGLGGIHLQPEVLFNTKGASIEGTDDLDLTYLEIPILLKKNFAKVLNIHLGPQFGILTKAEDSDGNDVKDFLKGSDISAVFGAGVDLPGGLGGGARYVLGLGDISEQEFSSVDVKNRTFQIYIQYKLFGN